MSRETSGNVSTNFAAEDEQIIANIVKLKALSIQSPNHILTNIPPSSQVKELQTPNINFKVLTTSKKWLAKFERKQKRKRERTKLEQEQAMSARACNKADKRQHMEMGQRLKKKTDNYDRKVMGLLSQ